ncbi:NINE protein [Hymenobacter algoricola]|uniref:NINE protein n=1 Tax=Hymenobacter algoricola TaxID=486267 RepID=A0ABP7NTB3_9BACT
MKNRTTAAIIAFFLGGFGGQFFYLGRAGTGVICILFCWTFIPAFIALYHFIKFLTMTDEAFNAEYNGGMSPMGYSSTGAGDELSKLFDLKEKGAITEDEYNARKSRLLA